MPCHDDFTTYYLVDQSDFIGQKLRIQVETSGEKRGQLQVTEDKRFKEMLYVNNVSGKANKKFLDALYLAV